MKELIACSLLLLIAAVMVARRRRNWFLLQGKKRVLFFDNSLRLWPISNNNSRHWYEVTVMGWYRDKPEQFRRRFRMYPSTFAALMDRLPYNPGRTWHPFNKPLTKHHALCIFVFRLAHTDSCENIADKFGTSKATVIKMTDHFLDAMAQCGFVSEMIRWPSVEEQRADALQWAMERASRTIRGAFGATDGILIRIPKQPGEDFRDFTCRKLFYALNVMCSCNFMGIFIDADIGCAGANNDLSVFLQSEMNQRGNFGVNCFLLGDSAYPLRPFLLVPYDGLDSSLSPAQLCFNNVHKSMRSVIEQAYGRLKGARFSNGN